MRKTGMIVWVGIALIVMVASCAGGDSVIQQGQVRVAVTPSGGLRVANGLASFLMESRFSYPGEKIGWNALSSNKAEGESGWKPRVQSTGKDALKVTANGVRYSLQRTVRLRNGRVEVEDTLKNTGSTPVGILISHDITAPEKLTNTLHLSTDQPAHNPFIFFSQSGGDFGIIAEDDIGRLQFHSRVSEAGAGVRHTNFALDAGKSYTFRYAIYPLERTGDFFTLINRVRRDWRSNFTIQGPWCFMDAPTVNRQSREELKKDIERRNIRVVSLSPFLDYDSGSVDHVYTREEFKPIFTEAARKLREVRPGIKVLGCIETDWVTIYPTNMVDGHIVADPDSPREDVARVIDAAGLLWADSIKRDRNGYVKIEHYTRGGKPQYALGVYPAPGNYQHRFLLEQAKFLMDDCGLDGFYIDEFTQAWSGSRSEYQRCYTGWDGLSAHVDPNTGEITAQYIDMSLAGKDSRLAIIKSALDRGGLIIANGYSTTMAEQPLPVFRFSETFSWVVSNERKPGEKPAVLFDLQESLLGSPLGLGSEAAKGEDDLAQGLMLNVIKYLRHGALYYHYRYPILPETGPGSGEYGPINHMFPFTPVELHEGWVKGKERILAARSFDTVWQKPGRPTPILFDIQGRRAPLDGKVRITGGKDNWRVTATLNDWAEILVIE